MLNLPTRLAAVLALFAAACASTAPRDLEPVGYLEVRFVDEGHGEPASLTELEFQGSALNYGPGQSFGLSEVGLSTDGLGRPALRFEVREIDKPAFSALVADHVGRNMAMRIDGEIITIATVNGPLPGSGQIEGDYDLADIEAMVAAILGEGSAD